MRRLLMSTLLVAACRRRGHGSNLWHCGPGGTQCGARSLHGAQQTLSMPPHACPSARSPGSPRAPRSRARRPFRFGPRHRGRRCAAATDRRRCLACWWCSAAASPQGVLLYEERPSKQRRDWDSWLGGRTLPLFGVEVDMAGIRTRCPLFPTRSRGERARRRERDRRQWGGAEREGVNWPMSARTEARRFRSSPPAIGAARAMNALEGIDATAAHRRGPGPGMVQSVPIARAWGRGSRARPSSSWRCSRPRASEACRSSASAGSSHQRGAGRHVWQHLPGERPPVAALTGATRAAVTTASPRGE
jgi:hypothetical protein